MSLVAAGLMDNAGRRILMMVSAGGVAFCGVLLLTGQSYIFDS